MNGTETFRETMTKEQGRRLKGRRIFRGAVRRSAESRKGRGCVVGEYRRTRNSEKFYGHLWLKLANRTRKDHENDIE